jgi:PBSX family phage terminase large subunit
VARPSKEIDQKQFENLCGLQCTYQEICDWFGVTDKTINAWCKRTYGMSFSEVFAQKKGNGKISLRRAQWQAAQKGNASLLIWLGKQYLNQTENPMQDAAGGEESKVFEVPARLISAPFLDVHRDITERGHMEYVEKGGRGSAKSSFISLEIVSLIKNNPTIHAVCCRKVGNTLRDSVYSQIEWAIGELGLDAEFERTKNPLEITYKPTGQKIYFRGADDPIKLKSIKPQFGYIGILWMEELDQFGGDEECRNIQQSVIRGGDEAYIFKSFNPPKAKNNWANLYVEQPKENRLVTHTDYRSVPKAWLGKAFLDEAEYLQGINPTAYEHEYLGIANGNGGMVFENVVAEMLTDEQINAFDRVLNGVDFGYFPDPWAFNRCQYDAARRILYIFDELTERKKVNQETAKVLQDHGITRDDKLTVDSADPKDAADYCKYGLKAVGARKGPGSVDRSMKWLQGLTKIVIDPARCPDTYKELTQYEYERTKDGEIISGYPDKDNHHIDAVRYATEEIWGRVGQNQMERRRAGWN